MGKTLFVSFNIFLVYFICVFFICWSCLFLPAYQTSQADMTAAAKAKATATV